MRVNSGLAVQRSRSAAVLGRSDVRPGERAGIYQSLTTLRPAAPGDGRTPVEVPRRPGEAGITLVDCLVYISLLGVFLYLTSVAVFQADMGSKHLRRNATEIARAMRAGEAWRDDLRGATGAVVSVRGAAGEGVRIPRARGAVVWAFREAGVWRTHDGTAGELLLPGVKASEMRADPQALAGVWRWEVELQTTRTNASVRPLFSFSAVAGAGGTK